MFGLWDDRGLDCGIINLVILNRRLDHRFLGTADDEDAVVDLPESIGNIALGIAAFNTGEGRYSLNGAPDGEALPLPRRTCARGRAVGGDDL